MYRLNYLDFLIILTAIISFLCGTMVTKNKIDISEENARLNQMILIIKESE